MGCSFSFLLEILQFRCLLCFLCGLLPFIPSFLGAITAVDAFCFFFLEVLWFPDVLVVCVLVLRLFCVFCSGFSFLFFDMSFAGVWIFELGCSLCLVGVAGFLGFFLVRVFFIICPVFYA